MLGETGGSAWVVGHCEQRQAEGSSCSLEGGIEMCFIDSGSRILGGRDLTEEAGGVFGSIRHRADM